MNIESIIRKGICSFYRGHEGIGGTLILTDRHVYYKPHPIHRGVESFTIDVQDIQKVRLLNNWRIFSYGFVVECYDGRLFSFAVWRRKLWLNEIVKASQNIIQ